MALYWRLKGEVEFTTVARRNQFATYLSNYESGRVIILDQTMTTSDNPPLLRLDLALESDSDMQALWANVQARPTSGIVRYNLVLHRCACFTPGDIPPYATNDYARWP